MEGLPQARQLGPAGLAPSAPGGAQAFEATGCAVFKFVVASAADLDEVEAIVGGCGLSTMYVMPDGTDAAVLTGRMGELGDAVRSRGRQLTTRLHILLWGDR
jgi:hypothetical protein